MTNSFLRRRSTGLVAAVYLAVVPTFGGAYANELCPQMHDKFYQSNKGPAHESITADLFNGVVIEARPFSKNDNQTPLMLVKVRNPLSGRTRSALFKPREFGDREGWARQPIEFVAYELNLMLGMDYVPPVAYRRNISVNGVTYGEGALLHLVEDPHSIYKVPEAEWGTRKDLLLSDVRVLDVMIQNSDRHKENFLRGRHWVDGTYRPMFIDQAAGFRRGAYVTMEQDNAFGTGAIKSVRKSTLESLRRLARDELKRRFSEFVSNDELDGLMVRKAGIVSYFDKVIAAQGYEKTVFDQ